MTLWAPAMQLDFQIPFSRLTAGKTFVLFTKYLLEREVTETQQTGNVRISLQSLF